MRKPLLMAAVAIAALLSAGAVASYVVWKNPSYAEVVSVEPVRQTVSTPEKVCTDEQVVRRRPIPEEVQDSDRRDNETKQEKDDRGTVVSRAARRPVGTGTGSTVVAGRGAVADGHVESDRHAVVPEVKAQKKIRPKDTYAATVRQCKTITQLSEKVVAYDVRYRLRGKTSKVRMDHDPGKRIPVRNGKLAVQGDANDSSGFRG
jgi:uncharacterized protein YcfJ